MKCVNKVVFFAYLCIVYTKSQNLLSPCPRYFQYEFDGYDWVGVMAIPSPALGQPLTVNVHLSIATQLLSYFGRLELLPSRSEIIQDIFAGRPVKYKVRFPLPKPIPKLTGIIVNNQRICSGPPATGSVITSIKLEHTLYTSAASNSFVNPNLVNNVVVESESVFSNNQNPNNGFYANNGFNSQNQNIPNKVNTESNWDNGVTIFKPTQDVFITDFIVTSGPTSERPIAPQTRPPQQTRPPPQFRPTPQLQTQTRPSSETRPPPQIPQQATPTLPPRNKQENIISELSEICGIAKSGPNLLIVKGEMTRPGDWPWLVALYTVTDIGLNFNCGGTLISHKMVITAAHCIYQRYGTVTETNKILLILGRHNINNWTDDAIRAVVERAIPHPEYSPTQVTTADADIAVLMLKNRVEFTDNIRPLCLWSGPSDLELVVGQEGTVVGWGRDETGLKTTPEPRLAKIKIVSQRECIFSKEEFRYLTSERTFCAGNRNGSGPCNGDSGGGLLLPRNSRWSLRGIVSVSLTDQITKQCDVNEYIIFTDATKYHSWIMQYMIE